MTVPIRIAVKTATADVIDAPVKFVKIAEVVIIPYAIIIRASAATKVDRVAPPDAPAENVRFQAVVGVAKKDVIGARASAALSPDAIQDTHVRYVTIALYTVSTADIQGAVITTMSATFVSSAATTVAAV